MILKKILRFTALTLLLIVVALLILVGFSIGPVDRTPAAAFESYKAMMQDLANADTLEIPKPTAGFSVGYAKINLTPSEPTATAGYGNRRGKLFTAVLDSIYVRTLVVSTGREKVAIVSADLLIVPPKVTERLAEELPKIGFTLENTFLGATHTHNSIGNWGEGATRFIYGPYEQSIVDFITARIILSIQQASVNMKASEIKTGFIEAPIPVDNRLLDGGPEDSLLRVMEIHRSDSSKLLFLSYTAHATCLFSRDIVLSRDYPGKLVDTLEQAGYDFAMFMAGAVGSHGCDAPVFGTDCIDWMAGEISGKFLSSRSKLRSVKDSTLMMVRVPLLLSNPQVKVLPDWKVRAWLFRSAFGEYPVYLTALRIGDVVMLGTPCDFSGEFNSAIDSAGFQKGLYPIVTSFNGGYIGYVTPQIRYDEDHYETQLMNWYAPGTGEYMKESLVKLMDIVSK